jgi:hypothetical protein
MDVGHTYASAEGVRLCLYVVAEVAPPETLELERDGKPITFDRVSEGSLHCGHVLGIKGNCTSYECHRAELGKCQCGRHEFGVPIRRAAG